MEGIESTYGPLKIDERAYLFFPSSNTSSTQIKKSKLKKAKKEADSFSSDKSNMMSMKKES